MTESHTYGDLWDAVQSERRRQAVTVRELSKRAGIPVPTLNGYLYGKSDPPHGRVMKLAAALGIEVRASVTNGYEGELAA